MSLATRCTHCGTIFKVVEDQLKVSEGWVRCGRCQQVFHALPTLFDLEREAPPPRPVPSVPQPEPAAGHDAGDRDNPPSQPAEWAATQPLTQPGELSDSSAPNAAHTHTAAAPADAPPPGPHIGLQPPPPQTRSWLAPVPATTEFDLDTAVPTPEALPGAPVAQPTAPAAPLTPGLDDIELDTAVALTPRQPVQAQSPPEPTANATIVGSQAAGHAASDATWVQPSGFDLVPSTEESDALDSRYLMPSDRRERPAARRPSHAQDFADAEVPDDWLLDAEEAFANTPPPSQPPVYGGPPTTPAAPDALITVLAEPRPPADAAAHLGPDSVPTTQPSRFADDADAAETTDASATGLVATGTPGTLTTTATDAAPTAETPSFVQRAQARARWRHPAMRALLAVMALLLAGLLVGQITHQFRDLIAAHHPPMRPLLARWCALAGCELRPPLRIEDLQVESLSFVRATSEGPDVYRLTVVLHNKAPIDLAWPQLDLSLTDLQGAVVLRRAFDPKDASWQDGAEPQSAVGLPTPAAVPADRSTTLQWRMKIAKLQPAGYTADIFYP